MNKPSVILVDDHRLFRTGLKLMIDGDGRFSITGEASDIDSLILLLEKGIPDLVILDMSSPCTDSTDSIHLILSMYPTLKILILSTCDEPRYYKTLIDSGIRGFLLNSDSKEFFEAIMKILAGETYFSQSLLMNIIKENARIPVKLSPREKEILLFISRGLSNQEIAASLKLSQRTIERHRTNLLEKTGSKNSIRLVIYALKHNIINI